MVQDEEHKEEEEEEDDFQTDEDEEMEVDEQVTSKRKKASFLNMYLKWCVCVCLVQIPLTSVIAVFSHPQVQDGGFQKKFRNNNWKRKKTKKLQNGKWKRTKPVH